MTEPSRTDQELIEEISILKQRIRELEQSESRRNQPEQGLNTLQDFSESILDSLTDHLIVIDPADYTILAANKTFTNSHGLDKNTVIGRHCHDLTHNRAIPCSPPDDICPLAETLKTGKPSTAEHIHYDSTGNKHYVEVSTIPIISNGAEIRQIIHLSRDISVRKQAEETLKEFERKFRPLAEQSLVGVSIVQDGVFKYVNSKYSEIHGYTVDELMDNFPFQNLVHPNDRQMADERIKKRLAGKEVNGQAELKKVKKNGDIIDVIHFGTVECFNGKPAIFGFLLDVTDRKRLEKTLQMHSVIMVNLAEGVHLTRADDSVILYANPQLEKMLGYGPGELIGKNVSVVNAPTVRSPEDTAKEIMESLNKNKVWSGEIKNIRKDGTFLWCYASVTTFDHPVYGRVWVSVHTDITRRKQVEEALKESEAKYYDLYENAPDMYYSLDLEAGATITQCNETLLRTTGYSREELIGRPIFELYDSSSTAEAKNAVQQFRATGEVRDTERRVKCKDGRIIDVSLNVSAIKDKDGKNKYSRSIWRDITKRKEQEETIRALSITDQLTGLYNRRGFTTLAEQHLRIAERTRKGMFILFADVDNLKQVNDKLGHKSGDEAIVEAANVLREAFRKMDIIARMGGDEFAVLAAEASPDYADMIKNRLQDRLDIHNSRAGRDYNLSLSIGMVYHPPPPPDSLDELISRADLLMYEEKRRKMSLESQE